MNESVVNGNHCIELLIAVFAENRQQNANMKVSHVLNTRGDQDTPSVTMATVPLSPSPPSDFSPDSQRAPSASMQVCPIV